MYHPDFDKEHWSHHDIKQLPVYKKAWEIIEMVNAISNTVIDDTNEPLLQESIAIIAENSVLLPVKIAGAMGGGFYDLKMENATIIRKAAREIYVAANSLKRWGYEYPEYCEKLRSIIWDEFRPLFAEWVAHFDEWDYIKDQWGLFNPPGVHWDDEDPDQQISLHNLFFDEEE